MANHCYNSASIEGSKEMLDLFEKRLAEATKDTKHLWWETYFQVLGMPLVDGVSYEVFGSRWFVDGVSYEVFGSRWFNAYWERHSPTSGLFSGDSAWSPVSEFFRKLSDVYQLEIESEFEEGGSDYGGWFYCKNGEVTKDVTVSYNAFRFTTEDTEFFYSLIEDIEDGSSYESIEDFDEEFISLLSETQLQELTEAFNKSKTIEQ